MSEDEDRLVAPADFNGPTKNRHCTDLLCLLLLIAAWIAMTGVGIYAVVHGDLRLVINPLDYDGNICGTDFAADMRDYPNLLYINSYTGGVCVKQCPDLTNQTADGLTDVRTLVTYSGIWQYEGGGAELSPDFIQVGDYSNSTDAIACTNATCFPNNSTQLSWISRGISEGNGYAYYAATTYELLYRCYLTTAASARIANLTEANTTSGLANVGFSNDVYSFWNKLYSDIYVARSYILGFGFGLSMGISLVYIFLMRSPGLLTTVIWSSIFVTIAMFFLGGYYAYNKATLWAKQDPKTVSDQTIHVTTIFSLVLYGIGGVLILLACCLRRAIMDAIKCAKEAGRAVNSMALILLVPFLQSIGFLLFLVPFVYYAANLASLGTITTTNVPIGVEVPGVTGAVPTIAFRVIEFSSFVKECGWYLLFCFFWTANFVVGMGDMIIALSVAKWYFTKNKLTIGSWTVIGSIVDVCWYHAGTAAFGSLLVAIIQVIRTVIAKAQKEAKKANSKLAECLLCCCQCCFWCLECALKYINKNAYIQTAIFSTSFCKSCRQSFALIFRNAARCAAISYVSSAILIVGKLFISSVVTLFGYYIILQNIGDQLFSVGGPVAVIFLISYFVSDMFMDVLDMGISTVLHCFVADEEMFEEGDRYHDESLKDYVDKHGSHE